MQLKRECLSWWPDNSGTDRQVGEAISTSTFNLLHMLLLMVSHVRLFAAPGTIAHQAPWPMEFSRQEY